ncbi:hypothetical protein OG453_30215 [Streptomyces sp. NBC_01381]|uniref:hypothetical protein n=1 Tax=Streptomyces sp. NBC_01381 TaxID=2903845 RepID=UPI0022510961|nr:hypothetical protein [Streptomyces sp. NBC_01381]MCX4670922.1 hypothetical protein [Streptomyces sp. NBC_01381]
MKPQVNIIAVVDVIGALSGSTLLDGNLCMMDDGGHNSAHQGTPNLCTVVKPGQVVSWSALAVDLQTPVEIKNISFVPADKSADQPASRPAGQPAGQTNGHAQPAQGERSADGDKLDLDVWTGVVPNWLTPGVAYQYRLELQMYEGENSVMHIDTPALMCQ